MRRTSVLVLLPLIGSLFATSPAEAVPFIDPLYFDIVDGGPGTISYAGSTAPLAGRNISVFEISESPGNIAAGPNFSCVECFLNFTTGPFVSGTPPGTYQFASGGSFEIIGGTIPRNWGHPFPILTANLPVGTSLLTGAITGAGVSGGDCLVPGACSDVFFGYDQGVLNPIIVSDFGLPGSSVSGSALIETPQTLNNSPDPFVLSGFSFTFHGEPSFVQAGGFKVPVPATFWPFAVGFVTLVAWPWRQGPVTDNS